VRHSCLPCVFCVLAASVLSFPRAWAVEPDTDGDGMPDTWEEAHRGAILFQDDFNDGNADGWTPMRRVWEVIDGRYVLSQGELPGFSYYANNYHRGGHVYTHLGDTNWTDYSVEMLIGPYPRGSSGWWPMGYFESAHILDVNFRVTAFDSYGQTDVWDYCTFGHMDPATTAPGFVPSSYWMSHTVNRQTADGTNVQWGTSGLIAQGTNYVAILAIGTRGYGFINANGWSMALI